MTDLIPPQQVEYSICWKELGLGSWISGLAVGFDSCVVHTNLACLLFLALFWLCTDLEKYLALSCV